MSDKDVRRPRAIIEAVPERLPGAPPPHAVAQAERFQRALQGRRFDNARSERASPRLASSSTTSSESAPPAAPNGGGDGAKRKAAVSTGSAPAPATVTGRPVDETAPTGFAPILHQPPVPERGADEVDLIEEPAPVAGTLGWDGELVQMIAAMCQRTTSSIEAWSIVLPMNAEVLPETELHLSLSAHRLSLRFHTQSGYSLRVLSDHRDSLTLMLRQALPHQREIDIDIT